MVVYNDEEVFPVGHELHNVIVYDVREGKYYNKQTDMFLADEEVKIYLR